MTSKNQKIGMMEIILKEINEAGGIEASAIASRDGLLICTTLSDQNQAEIFVAMSATMIGAAEAVSTELGKGIPERTIVETQTGKIIGTGAGPKAIAIGYDRMQILDWFFPK